MRLAQFSTESDRVFCGEPWLSVWFVKLKMCWYDIHVY